MSRYIYCLYLKRGDDNLPKSTFPCLLQWYHELRKRINYNLSEPPKFTLILLFNVFMNVYWIRRSGN